MIFPNGNFLLIIFNYCPNFLGCLRSPLTPLTCSSDEVVEVRTDELPDNVEDLLGILQAEMAPLSLWLKFAVEYYKQGKCYVFSLPKTGDIFRKLVLILLITPVGIMFDYLRYPGYLITSSLLGSYFSTPFCLGKIQQFQDILKEATSPDADNFFQSQTRNRIQVLNSQAAFYVAQAKHEKNKAQKDNLFNLATLAYNKAEKIDITDELIYAGKGTCFII